MMRFSSFRFIASIVAAGLFLPACSHLGVKEPVAPTPPPKPVKVVHETYWEGDGVKGRPSLVISLSDQRAYFYRDEKVVGESPISSGKKGYDTPPGEYKVIQKDKDHESNLYGEFIDAEGTVVKANADTSKDKAPEGTTFKGAKMSYFLRFTGGYGLHAGKLPGHRASHGCVRLPRSMAQHFFENAEVGMAVEVRE